MPKKTNRSQKMTKAQKAKDEQPWNQQFEDDRDDDGNFSRIQRRKHSRGNTVLAVVLIIAIVLVCLAPIIWQAVSKRMANSAESTTRISIATTTDKSSKSSQKATSKKRSSSSAKSSSSSAVSSSTSVSSSSSASSSSSSTSGSYTVKSGDNLYRIAVNHGMTLTEIQALNGMGSSTSVTPGQTLKVK